MVPAIDDDTVSANHIFVEGATFVNMWYHVLRHLYTSVWIKISVFIHSKPISFKAGVHFWLNVSKTQPLDPLKSIHTL